MESEHGLSVVAHMKGATWPGPRAGSGVRRICDAVRRICEVVGRLREVVGYRKETPAGKGRGRQYCASARVKTTWPRARQRYKEELK